MFLEHIQLLKRICDKSLKELGIQYVVPNKADQNIVGKTILNIIGGQTRKKDVIALNKVIKNLQTNGADAIMLACTELPLILKQTDVDMPLIDCNKLYSEKVAEYSRNTS